MQEIKFRYTVKRKNGHIFSEIFTLKDIEDGEVKIFKQFNYINDEDLIIEQFTGKQDKNGKDIYEGDICKIIRYGNKFIIGKIYFASGYFHIENGYAFCGTDCLSHIRSSIIEIIGNIHKNHELLEAEK